MEALTWDIQCVYLSVSIYLSDKYKIPLFHVVSPMELLLACPFKDSLQYVFNHIEIKFMIYHHFYRSQVVIYWEEKKAGPIR